MGIYTVYDPGSKEKQGEEVGVTEKQLLITGKEILDRMIEEFLFTPRARSTQHAQQFLRDWIQRYSR